MLEWPCFVNLEGKPGVFYFVSIKKLGKLKPDLLQISLSSPLPPHAGGLFTLFITVLWES